MTENKISKDIKINYVTDMYKEYVRRELEAHPTYYEVYDSVLSMKGIKLLMRKNYKGKEEVVMSYTLFRSILEKCNKLIINTILQGEKFYFGHSLGFLQGSRIERNFDKKVVNRFATAQYRKETGNKDAVIFHTSDTYCRISWMKLRTLRNSTVYELSPTKNFKRVFSEALTSNPMLELSFPYYKRA